jgi:hypothetical protein
LLGRVCDKSVNSRQLLGVDRVGQALMPCPRCPTLPGAGVVAQTGCKMGCGVVVRIVWRFPGRHRDGRPDRARNLALGAVALAAWIAAIVHGRRIRRSDGPRLMPWPST